MNPGRRQIWLPPRWVGGEVFGVKAAQVAGAKSGNGHERGPPPDVAAPQMVGGGSRSLVPRRLEWPVPNLETAMNSEPPVRSFQFLARTMAKMPVFTA